MSLTSRSNKEINLIGSSIIRCNKIKLKKIVNHNKSLKGTYYIQIFINTGNPQNTKQFNFKESSSFLLDETFVLDPQDKKLNKITFIFFENKTPKPLYIGIIQDQHFILDDKTGDYLINLKNNEDSDTIEVYYSIEYAAIDAIKSFDDNYKYSNNLKHHNSSHNLGSSKSYHPDEKTKRLFIKNLRYVLMLINYFDKIIHWKSKINTLSFLIVSSLIIYYFKTFYIYIFPLYILLLYVTKKNSLKSYLIDKENMDNSIEIQNENELFYLKVLSTYNMIIEKYENFVKNIFSGRKMTMENMYKSLILTIIINLVFFYLGIFYLINFKILLIIVINSFILRQNPFFYNIFSKLFNFISNHSTIITNRKFFIFLKEYIPTILRLLIPFYSIYMSYKEENENVFHSAVKSQGSENSNVSTIKVSKSFTKTHSKINSESNLVKIELYELQRWWVVVGWTSNLGGNNNCWYKVGKPEEYCDKNSVFLPDNENTKYQWSGEWKVEKMEHSDEEGWEYSDSTNGDFFIYKTGKFVRRRKWVRYANKV